MYSSRLNRRTQRRWLIAFIALIAILAAVALLLPQRDWTSPPKTETSSAVTPTTPPAPSLPPAPMAPVSVRDTVPLTLPQELRAASGTVYLEAGENYVASFEVSTVKPKEEPGLGMYLGVTFGCSGKETDLSDWIGGTENILRADPVTYANQMLLQPETAQVITCSVRANAPNDDVAAAGATINLNISWTVEKVDSSVRSTPAEPRLPMAVDSDGGRDVAFAQTVDVDHDDIHNVQVLSSLHLTTCTIVNGSREAGKTWCQEDAVHEDGSDFDIELRLDVLDEDGTRCGTVGVKKDRHILSLERHHQLISRQATFALPRTLCGPIVRVSVVVENRGPAPLVVHASNSSMLTIPT